MSNLNTTKLQKNFTTVFYFKIISNTMYLEIRGTASKPVYPDN